MLLETTLVETPLVESKLLESRFSGNLNTGSPISGIRIIRGIDLAENTITDLT